jgi:hypothetical protein
MAASDKLHAPIIITELNSTQFFFIYAPNQQLQGQLQTQHSADTSNYIIHRTQHKVKDKLQEGTEGKEH